MNRTGNTQSSDPGRTVVVGAGPHALTFCVYLLAARPDWRDHLTVIDPDGWIEAWNARFARLGISVLRSPCVHHPDPNPYALADFAVHRPDDLIGEYKAPTTSLFAEFCDHLIRVHRLASIERRGLVTAVHPGVDGAPTRVELASGCHLNADHVVIATNPATPRIPAWAAVHRATRTALREVVRHAETIDITDVSPGQRIVVVGGGLTAAQLALGATRAGAHVTVLTPGPLRAAITDIDPTWLGPHQLRPYFADPDWEHRAGRYHQARRGTIPPGCIADLHHAASTGTLDLRESTTVTALHITHQTATLSTTAGPITADLVWLATGWDHNTRNNPLLAALNPTVTSSGLPIIDNALRVPGTAIHLMGAAAALQIGAAAPNLAGARIASERLVTELTGNPPAQYPHPHIATPTPGQYLQRPRDITRSVDQGPHRPATAIRPSGPTDATAARHQPPRRRGVERGSNHALGVRDNRL